MTTVYFPVLLSVIILFMVHIEPVSSRCRKLVRNGIRLVNLYFQKLIGIPSIFMVGWWSVAIASEPLQPVLINSSEQLKPPPIRIERNVAFHQVDGQKISADLYRPVGDEKLPGVVMIHGGGWVGGDKWNVVDHAAELAEAGFVVMAVNYRLSPAVKWPCHLEDCQKGLLWLVEHSLDWHVDTQRIGTWGYSAGAQLALLLALDPKPDLPKITACVAGGAPCDLSFVPEQSSMLASIFGGTREALPERYRDASPSHFISRAIRLSSSFMAPMTCLYR